MQNTFSPNHLFSHILCRVVGVRKCDASENIKELTEVNFFAKMMLI